VVTGGFVIRPAVPDDARQISRVHVISWQTAYRGVFPDDWLDALTVEEREPWWQRLLADADTATLVAAVGETVVGFAQLGPDRDDQSRGEIRAIYLEPEVWRRGIGQALMIASEETLAERYALAVLWVLDRNERARRFYEAVGWATDGATKQDVIFGRAATEVRYRKDLPPGPAEGSSNL
jgi:ribosomal protein S18 acetylase RimI-like enzyme